MTTSGTASSVYVERFAASPTRLCVSVLLLAAGVLASPLLTSNPGIVAVGVTLGLTGLFRLIPVVRRQVAFRVDEHGIVLGGTPLRHRAHTVSVPWRDIEAIVLWDLDPRVAGARSVVYVGLRRSAGAPVLPGPDRSASEATAARLAPQVGRGVLRASRAMVLWRVDYQRLAAARDAFAPDVPIEDTTGRYGPSNPA